MQTNEQKTVYLSMITHQSLPFGFLVGNFLSSHAARIEFCTRAGDFGHAQQSRWINGSSAAGSVCLHNIFR